MERTFVGNLAEGGSDGGALGTAPGGTALLSTAASAGEAAGGASPWLLATPSLPRVFTCSLFILPSVALSGILAGQTSEARLGVGREAAIVDAAWGGSVPRLAPPEGASASGQPPIVAGTEGVAVGNVFVAAGPGSSGVDATGFADGDAISASGARAAADTCVGEAELGWEAAAWTTSDDGENPPVFVQSLSRHGPASDLHVRARNHDPF